MESINQTTAQTLASTKQTEKAAENLSELGVRLKEIVSSYQVEDTEKAKLNSGMFTFKGV